MLALIPYLALIWLSLISGSRTVHINTSPELTLAAGSKPFEGMSFDESTGLEEQSTFSNITCGAPSTTGSKDGHDYILSEDIDTSLPCKSLLGLARNRSVQERWQESHDAYKAYIEKCAMEPMSYTAFSGLGGTNQNRSTDPNRYPEHLQWLKKVLYYNPDTLYYCEDVFSMLSTFKYFNEEHGGFYGYQEGGITVAQYLKDSAHCGYLDETLEKMIKQGLQIIYDAWKDSVKDSVNNPFNPHFPSLEELDLTILRGPQSSVSAGETRIGTLTASPNPFGESLELRYDLIKSAMVRIDVYDILGRPVYESPQGFKEKGEHHLTIPSNWTSGTYYIRLSTPSGEIKTVKVVKE